MRKYLWATFLSALLLFAVSAGALVERGLAAREQGRLDRLAALVPPSKAELAGAAKTGGAPAGQKPVGAEGDPEPGETSARLEAYRALWEENPDMIGWVSIAGTEIDYPVMQTPDDPEFYLRRDFARNRAVLGLPFLDARCAAGQAGQNLLVYGHNMSDGSMFAGLLDYQDQSFWQEHQEISFDTLEEEGRYQVMAAFYSKVYYTTDRAFRYYNYAGALSEEEFQEYLTNVRELSLYDTGETAAYGDSLLTLTTCAYHTKNGRFVVVARRVD